MEGKVAVVTGATGGIGSEIARHLAGKGSSLVLTGLGSQEEIDALVQELSGGPGKVDFVPADLSKRDDVSAFCQRVLELHPNGIHILINVAGVQFSHALEDYPPEKWDLMVALHLTAPFLLTQHFLPGMKKNRWGRIVNMASQMAFVSAAGRAPYTAVKAGLVGLTKGVAVEGAAFGVTCNALCPGFVDAPMFHRAMEVKAEAAGTTAEKEKADFQKKMCPNGRLITVQEVAETVCFLCSESAASISGASLLQDAAFTATVPGLVTATSPANPGLTSDAMRPFAE